jgi:hypothetical protein
VDNLEITLAKKHSKPRISLFGSNLNTIYSFLTLYIIHIDKYNIKINYNLYKLIGLDYIIINYITNYKKYIVLEN